MKPRHDLTQEAIEALFRELGVIATARFVNQLTTGWGNYTEERRDLFEDMSLDEIVKAIHDRRSH